MSVPLGIAEAVMGRLYGEVSGYKLSHASRDDAGLTDRGFVYGEVMPSAFQTLLQTTSPARGETFVDLGSGLGKPVLLAAMLFEFAHCEGHELLPQLAAAAEKAGHGLAEALRAEGAKAEDAAVVKLVEGDLLQAKLTQAGVVFTHASCFDEPLLKALAKKLDAELPAGARVLVVGHWLEGRRLRRRKTSNVMMDWGETVVNLYEVTG